MQKAHSSQLPWASWFAVHNFIIYILGVLRMMLISALEYGILALSGIVGGEEIG